MDHKTLGTRKRWASLLLVAYFGGCGSSAPMAAHVGDTSISTAAVHHWASIEAAAGGAPNRDAHTRRALGTLISIDRLLAEASELGIDASEKEVRNRLSEYEYDRARNIKFKLSSKDTTVSSLLGRSGANSSDRLLLIRLDTLMAKVEHKLFADAERSIGQQEVSSYYATNKPRFVLPERRNIEVLGNYHLPVVLKSKREIEAGANFVALAKRVSVVPCAPQGVQLNLARGTEEPDYDKIIFAAKPGALVGPKRGSAFYYILRVTKVTPSHQQSLAQAQSAIRRQIVAAKRQTILAEYRHEVEHRWRTKTDCSQGLIVPGCRQYRSSSPSSQ